jgi:hypothetical protein
MKANLLIFLCLVVLAQCMCNEMINSNNTIWFCQTCPSPFFEKCNIVPISNQKICMDTLVPGCGKSYVTCATIQPACTNCIGDVCYWPTKPIPPALLYPVPEPISPPIPFIQPLTPVQVPMSSNSNTVLIIIIVCSSVGGVLVLLLSYILVVKMFTCLCQVQNVEMV